MSWIPIGPQTILAPQLPPYTRITRSGFGTHCAVLSIAVSPMNRNHIAVVTRRVGGTSAFITLDDGHSWTAIADELTRELYPLDLSCVAFHPTIRGTLYLGARDGRKVLISHNYGRQWLDRIDLPGKVTHIIIESNDMIFSNTKVYAATNIGVATSYNGGVDWTTVLIGEVTSFAAYLPHPDSHEIPQFYAGVFDSGLHVSSHPGSRDWTRVLTFPPTRGAGLPRPAGSHFTVYVDFAAREPNRVYALVVGMPFPHRSPNYTQLLVSSIREPAWDWAPRGVVNAMGVDVFLEGAQLLVVPNFTTLPQPDILFCTGQTNVIRSIDAGLTWQGAAADTATAIDNSNLHHADMRAFALFPPKNQYYPFLPIPTPEQPPRIYLGSDGGLASSIQYTNPRFTLATFNLAQQTNTYDVYDASGIVYESLNSGLASVAAHQSAHQTDPRAGGPFAMVSFLTMLDTGLAQRNGALAWQRNAGADAGLVFFAPEMGRIRVWCNLYTGDGFPSWFLQTSLADEWALPSLLPVMPPDATSCGPISNMVSDGLDGLFVSIVSLSSAAMAMFQVAHISAMNATAALPVGHFSENEPVYRIACAVSTDIILAASVDQQLWIIHNATTATIADSWVQIADQPVGLFGNRLRVPFDTAYYSSNGLEQQADQCVICWITSVEDDVFYIMLSRPINALVPGSGTESFSTPLFQVDRTARPPRWIPQRCNIPDSAIAGLPEYSTLGQMVAHPTLATRLYVSRRERVFQIDLVAGIWNWTELSNSLPGQDIHSLWIGNIAPTSTLPPHFILRATTAVRGIWEWEIDVPAPPPAIRPYFHDHQFDPGWLGHSVDGVTNPFTPTQRHYHWQSADITVDTPRTDTRGGQYYQNEPEIPNPTGHEFVWFKDRSEAVPEGSLAHVWVRINNRSTTPSGVLHVCAISCPYSGALPALPADFWTIFDSTGIITPPMLTGGWELLPMQYVAGWELLPMQYVEGIHAENPGILMYSVNLRTAYHKCVVIFVHGPQALLDVTGLSQSIDEVVPQRAQIAQRNVIVEERRRPMALSADTADTPGTTAEGRADAIEAPRHYIEFNNPTKATQENSVVFDLRDLPPNFTLHFQLASQNQPKSMTGAKRLPFWDNFMDWLRSTWRNWKRPNIPDYPVLSITWPIYRAEPGKEVRLDGITLKAGDKTAAMFWLEESELGQAGELKAGYEYHLDILQYAEKKLLGGATVVIPIPAKPTDPATPEHAENEREMAGRTQYRDD